MPRKYTDAERVAAFWAKVNKSEGCWEWTGARQPAGYGTVRVLNRTCLAHRVAYESLVGPIPDGLHLDHLCRNPSCVNPAHLEPVTNRENITRGLCAVRGTHCKRGHEFTPENTYNVPKTGQRQCRECVRLHAARYRALARGETSDLVVERDGGWTARRTGELAA